MMPGHTFLYRPPVVAIKELIDSGELGELYFVSSSRVNLGLHQPDVSVVWDLGPHDFSIFRYWLGESRTTVSPMSRDCVIPALRTLRSSISATLGGTTSPTSTSMACAQQVSPDRSRRLSTDDRLR